jgi:hypothetical protein
MEAVIAFVLTVLVASFIAWPLFAAQAPGGDGSPQSGQTRWQRQKAEAYAAIKEAEFDHQMGKLTDADFAALQHKYREQALAAIKAMEAEHGEGSVSTGRGAHGHKPSRIAYCPGCGHQAPPRANFCPGCGNGLKVLLKEAVA